MNSTTRIIGLSWVFLITASGALWAEAQNSQRASAYAQQQRLAQQQAQRLRYQQQLARQQQAAAAAAQRGRYPQQRRPQDNRSPQVQRQNYQRSTGQNAATTQAAAAAAAARQRQLQMQQRARQTGQPQANPYAQQRQRYQQQAAQQRAAQQRAAQQRANSAAAAAAATRARQRQQQSQTRTPAGRTPYAQQRQSYQRQAGQPNAAAAAAAVRQRQQAVTPTQQQRNAYPQQVQQQRQNYGRAATPQRTNPAAAANARARQPYPQNYAPRTRPKAPAQAGRQTPQRAPSTAYSRRRPSRSRKMAGGGVATGQNRMLKKLKKKFSDEEGDPKKVTVLNPLDYTKKRFASTGKREIKEFLKKYGAGKVVFSDAKIDGLTLEDLRKTSIVTDSPIIIATLFKPSAFEMFLYDRATPYKIFTYSQALPTHQAVNKQVLSYYARLLTQRTLYLYVQEQNYELPRKDVDPFLEERLPGRIANQEDFEDTNRALISRFYLSPGLGITLTRGSSGDLWNSNVLSLHAGIGVTDNTFLELGWDGFTYNALLASLKYLYRDRSSQWTLGLGIGGAILTTTKTLNWDQNFRSDMADTSGYVAGTFSVLFPIQDLNLKLDTRLFAGIGFQRFIFSLVPGILLFF